MRFFVELYESRPTQQPRTGEGGIPLEAHAAALIAFRKRYGADKRPAGFRVLVAGAPESVHGISMTFLTECCAFTAYPTDDVDALCAVSDASKAGVGRA